MSTARARYRFPFLYLCSLLILGCDGGPTDPILSYRLTIISGDGQTGAADAQLAEPLVVKVVDSKGKPVPGVTVGWSAEEPGGSVMTGTSPSVADQGGVVRVHRWLGREAGVHRTTASLGGGDAIHFISTAQVQGATVMTAHPDGGGQAQRDTVLATLSPFRVLIRDQDGFPVEGVIVNWSFSNRPSSNQTSATDANGVAETIYALGPTIGTELVRAAVSGLIGSPVHFVVTAEPGNPVRIVPAATDPVGIVGVERPYEVMVTDAHDNAISGIDVDWVVLDGGGSISPSRSTTVATGRFAPVAVSWHTFGTMEGPQVVMATAAGADRPLETRIEVRTVTTIVRVMMSHIDYYYYYYEGFYPTEAEVPVGRTVAWLWQCDEPCSYDVTFEDDPTQPVSSPAQSSGTHFRTFDSVGVYRYRSTNKSSSFLTGMVGLVGVVETP